MKNKSFIEAIAVAIIVLIIVAIVYAISGLCMWGIGNFVIYVFEIDYEWTYLHGLATSIVLAVVGSAFKSSSSSSK